MLRVVAFMSMASQQRHIIKGEIERGKRHFRQTEPKSRSFCFFFKIFADFCRFSHFLWNLQYFGGADLRRKLQETAGVRRNRRKLQNFAETHLSYLVCPL